MKLTASSSSKYFRKAASVPTRKMFADLRANGTLEFFCRRRHIGRGRADQRAASAAVRVHRLAGGVCRARRRARRPDPRRARAPRSPCLPPLLAERVSPLNHQHKTDPHSASDFAGLKIRSPGRRHCGGLLQDAWRPSWHGAVQRDVRCTEGAHLRRAERPARCCPVAAALRGADLSEPDCPLVVGLYAPGQ